MPKGAKCPKICTKWKFFERLEYKKKKINAAGKIKDAGRDKKLLFFYLPYKHVCPANKSESNKNISIYSYVAY
jgi:hypothetical protein